MSTRWPAQVSRTSMSGKVEASGRPPVGAAAPDDHPYRAGQDGQVPPDAPAVDVAQVELDALRPGDRRPAAHLGQAGQAGPGQEPTPLAGRVALDLAGHGGARAD